MIRAFHAISTLLLMAAIGFFLYNLIWQIMAHGQLKILSIEELWTSFDKPGFETVKALAAPGSPSGWALFAGAPAVTILLAIAGIFYVPILILKLLNARKKTQDWRF